MSDSRLVHVRAISYIHVQTSPQQSSHATAVSLMMKLRHGARSRAPLSGQIVVAHLRLKTGITRHKPAGRNNCSKLIRNDERFILYPLYLPALLFRECLLENSPF